MDKPYPIMTYTTVLRWFKICFDEFIAKYGPDSEKVSSKTSLSLELLESGFEDSKSQEREKLEQGYQRDLFDIWSLP